MRTVWFSACLLAFALPAQADEALWAKLKAGGNIVVIRHAEAAAAVEAGACTPGAGLSAEGAERARRLGRLLKFRAVNFTAPHACRRCPCLETARLVFAEEPQPWPARQAMDAPTLQRELAALAARLTPPYNAAVVMEQAGVRELTGISSAPAEIVVLRPADGKITLLGRLAPP